MSCDPAVIQETLPATWATYNGFFPSTFLVSWMSEITKHDFREHQPHSSFTPVSRKPSGHCVTDSIPARTKQMKSWLLLQETTPKSQPVQTTRKPRKGNTRQSKPWWTTDNPGFSLTEGEHFLTYSAGGQWLGPFALHLHAPPMLCLPFTFFFFWVSRETPSYAALDITTFHPKKSFCGMFLLACLWLLSSVVRPSQ